MHALPNEENKQGSILHDERLFGPTLFDFFVGCMGSLRLHTLLLARVGNGGLTRQTEGEREREESY